MKTYLIALSFLLAGTTLKAQTLKWAKSFGGSGSDFGYSVKTDGLGNVYTTGYFNGTADFDAGSGTYNLTSNGKADIFVQKMDPSGNFLWAKSFGGPNDDYGNSIALDGSGNVYITGYFAGTVDFDPGTGISNLTSAGGSYDVFIQKLDPNGNFIWAKSFGGPGDCRGYSIITDDLGNVITTGSFEGTSDFDPGTGTTNLTSAGGTEIFVQKSDSAGNFLWARSFGGISYDFSLSLTTDDSGNVYTTGHFEGTADFDPGTGTFSLKASGIADIFIQKMDASGNFLWAKSFGGTGGDYGHSIAADASGNIFTTGNFQGKVDFDPGTGVANLSSLGNADIFIQKLDPSGNFLWAKSFGGTGADRGNSVFSDASGNVYTTGYFENTADFDPGTGTTNFTSAGKADIFIHKLDPSGNFLWGKSFGGRNYEYGFSILADASGNVYTTGGFPGTLDFDPGADSVKLTSVGSDDIFVQKIGQDALITESLNTGMNISIYPNPTSGMIRVLCSGTLNPEEIQLSDLQGKVIYTKKWSAVSDTNFEIEGQAGIYFLKFITTNGQMVIKLIKV